MEQPSSGACAGAAAPLEAKRGASASDPETAAPLFIIASADRPLLGADLAIMCARLTSDMYQDALELDSDACSLGPWLAAGEPIVLIHATDAAVVNAPKPGTGPHSPCRYIRKDPRAPGGWAVSWHERDWNALAWPPTRSPPESLRALASSPRDA